MKMTKRMACVVLCLLAAALGAHSDPIVTVQDMQLADGLWQYEYSIDNSTGSAAIMVFSLSNIDAAALFASPDGWGATPIVDSDLGGYVMWWADPGAELSPGSVLAGFIIQSPYSSGTGTALAYLYDTDYNGYPVTLDGPASSSPEPAPLLLLGSGIVPLMFRWLKRRR
jgi:hypothetical protein